MGGFVLYLGNYVVGGFVLYRIRVWEGLFSI